MKKVIIALGGVFVGAVLVSQFSVFGVAEKQTANVVDAEASEKLVALSTFTIIADMVSEVGGDRIESISLTKPGAEIHGYQPTPGDLVTASRANVMFENGMNLELWTEKLRASLPDMPVVRVSEGVEVVNIAEDAYAGKPNPHAWMSPEQGLIYVENIRRALTEYAPEHAEYFAARAEAYSDQIKAVDSRLQTALANLPENNRVLVSCEGAFSYLTNDYGLTEEYLWAINSESQGSPQQVAKIIEVVKAKNIPAVFCESTVEPRIQQEVVAATGARFGGTLYVDSLSPSDGPASTYLQLLEHTANTIISGLTENS
ncbi:MAG TPA: metal ABC transporter substrate-binding protein [Candidatus Paceibacterota bacterium]|nr:metal ABC transporter substrate-binding protein [Candidatus Paceibacterota bacterium]HMO82587.1 metal ABC transporter substrate-binding protein [Candidatus Paceibacterota bacterium]